MSATLKKNNNINATQVETFLSKNPDFFQHHLHLLEEISIPHPSGKAVSLISKQLEVLRNKHSKLEQQLASLISIARVNDTVAKHLHQLTLAMLDVHTLEDLLANLEQVLQNNFLIDFVAVRILQENNASSISNLFLKPDDKDMNNFLEIIASNKPKCGKTTPSQSKFLFGSNCLQVKSSAIIPMSFTKIDAVLAIGSRQKDRFHQSMGHMFLQQISEIVGTRLLALLP